MAAALVACSAPASRSEAPEPVLIGVSLGLSNGLSALAQPLRDSVRVAEGQINAAGGVLGRPVRFDIQDDASDEQEGIVDRVARDFAARGAVAVLGPIGSQQVLKTRAIYTQSQMVQISPSATSTALTAPAPSKDKGSDGVSWFFRTTPADDVQALAVSLVAARASQLMMPVSQNTPPDMGGQAATVMLGRPCTRMALVHVDNAYGTSMADAIALNFPKRNGGAQVALRRRVSVRLEAKYAQLASEILSAAPECIALIAYEDVAASLIRDIKNDSRYASLKQQGLFFIGTDAVYTEGFLRAGRSNAADPTSANLVEGVIGTAPDTRPPTREHSEFQAIYGSYYPESAALVPAFAANMFDAAAAVALAIARAGSTTDRAAIRRALVQVSTPPGRPYTPAQLAEALAAAQRGEDIDYQGASGPVDFDASGNVQAGYVVWQAYRKPDQTFGFQTIARLSRADLL